LAPRAQIAATDLDDIRRAGVAERAYADGFAAGAVGENISICWSAGARALPVALAVFSRRRMIEPDQAAGEGSGLIGTGERSTHKHRGRGNNGAGEEGIEGARVKDVGKEAGMQGELGLSCSQEAIRGVYRRLKRFIAAAGTPEKLV